MPTKFLITIFAGIALIYSSLGCKKNVKFEQTSPLFYYLSKINGTHNWTGIYDNYTGHTIDTNVRFVIKAVSDSSIIIHIANRVQTLYYAETNEITKTISFSGSYDNSNSNYFSLFFNYDYTNGNMLYEEYYSYHPYGFYTRSLSEMILHNL